MLSKIFTSAALALAASTLVSAQTFTECDPTKKDCPPDPAFGGSVEVPLTSEPKDVFKNLAGTQVTYDGSKGAVFSIKAEGDAPTMASYRYMFFGRIEVTMQAAPGAGVVTSFVLQSDDLDEIDIEFVGGDNAQFQSNYFSKGDTSTYDRGAYHAVSNPTGQFHTYAIDWTKDHVQWILDGAVVRTVTYADAKGGATFPQTPMQIKFGTWVAGKKGASEGTVSWAGGYTNFADAPFLAYYKDIKITDNAGGVSGAKQYVYSDKSGTWQSIKVDLTGGDINTGDSGNSTSGSSTTSSKPSSSTMTTMSSSVTVSNATTTTSAAPTTTASKTTTGATTQTSAPNAAGKAGFAFGSVAFAGAALLAVNLLL